MLPTRLNDRWSERSDPAGDSFWTRQRPQDYMGAASACGHRSEDGDDVVENAWGELWCRVANARRQVIGVNHQFEGFVSAGTRRAARPARR